MTDLEELKNREPEEGPPIQFAPGRYYLGMWFIKLRREGSKFGEGGDWMAILWHKDVEPDKWYMLSRIRWYKGERVWESDDQRVWTFGSNQGTEEEQKAKLDQIATILHVANGLDQVEYLDIRGDCDKFESLEKPYWMHSQQMKAE